MIFVVLASALLATPARAFYLPGVAPREFPDGGEVALKVDKLTSVKSQLPCGFYDAGFCAPAEAGIVDPEARKAAEVHSMAENGQVLAGTAGVFWIQARHGTPPGCEVLCRKTFTKDETETLTKFIRRGPNNMWIDNLPAGQKLFNSQEAMAADSERMQKMRAGEGRTTD